MKGPRVREILLLTIVPLVLFLVLAEVGLRFYLARHTFYDVEMARYALSLKVDSENPRIGHVHRPGDEERLMGVDVRINAAGFRDDDVPLERTGRRRILLLGDSLTFGWGVEQEQSFEHLLEERLDAEQPTELINTAAGNYNTVQQVNLFLDVGLAYRPDQVVVFYFINDAEPVPVRSPWGWIGHSRIVTFYWSRVKALIGRFEPSAGYREWYAALYRDDAPGWQDAKAAFLQLKEVCDANGIALQVVLLPELHELVDYPFAEEYAAVTEFLDAHGIENLDLTPFFAGETDPQSLWVAPDDAHPNAEAHRRIADYSFSFISRGSDEAGRAGRDGSGVQ